MKHRLNFSGIVLISVVFLTLLAPNLYSKSDKCRNITIHIFNGNPGRKTVTVTRIRYRNPYGEKYVKEIEIGESISIEYLDSFEIVCDLPYLKKKKTRIEVTFKFGRKESLKQKSNNYVSYSGGFKCKKNLTVKIDIDGSNIKQEKEETGKK